MACCIGTLSFSWRLAKDLIVPASFSRVTLSNTHCPSTQEAAAMHAMTMRTRNERSVGGKGCNWDRARSWSTCER